LSEKPAWLNIIITFPRASALLFFKQMNVSDYLK